MPESVHAHKAGVRQLRPPAPLALFGEARFLGEWLAMRAARGRLKRDAPPGDGGPVLVAPGFATDDTWTDSLRAFLEAIGYKTRGWGLGRNNGRVQQLIPKLADQTEEFAQKTGRKVRLVGWSLGGYLAREVARERPQAVDRVVTLGTPVVGGPKYTASAPSYLRKGYDLDEIEKQVMEREKKAIRVPVHAIYSRSDGVVAWQACIDHHNPTVDHHRINASHLGLIASPTVYGLVARLLE